MSLNLRKKTRVSYYEPEEPSFDEYVYCEQCLDFVYDYCAIHGPLLVVPDDKVPAETNLPSYVPRAALTIPHIFLHLAPSIIPGAGLGVFSTLTLPRGVRFGPYRGQRTKEVDSMYCWQIYNRNNRRAHVIDAVNSDRSNWMRYVNCARHWKEQNLLAYQFKGQLYYRTIKIIPRFTELLVFYGSEYANALQINLAKYNSVEYYRRVISTQTPRLGAKNQVPDQDYLPAEQFHFIDEETQIEEKNPSTKTNHTSIPCQNNNKTEKNANGPNSKFECNTCNKSFLKQSYLKRHKILHSDTWRFACDKCDYKTNFPYRFTRHLAILQHVNRSETYGRSLKCDNCPYISKTKYNLARHIRSVHK